MKSPWTKKNPLMSMYLSGANAVAGSLRGHASSAAKRQASTSLTKAMKQLTGTWTDALFPSPTRKKRSKRR